MYDYIQMYSYMCLHVLIYMIISEELSVLGQSYSLPTPLLHASPRMSSSQKTPPIAQTLNESHLAPPLL